MKQKVGEFLFRRLHEAGLNDVFGVPGDYVLGLFNFCLEGKVKLTTTCNELNAAYAADGYARLNGIGGVVTTYVVGEFSALNGVAGSFAEHVPVVCITGTPATGHYRNNTLLHHTVGSYNLPLKLFREITVAQALIDNAAVAVIEIDKCLTSCLLHSMPVYIAVCSDVAQLEIDAPDKPFQWPQQLPSDLETLEECVKDTLEVLRTCKQPIVVPGMELSRFNMQGVLEEFIENSGLPYVTMMSSKGIIDEMNPNLLGIYSGNSSSDHVKEYVEKADFRLVLGFSLADFATQGFTPDQDPRTTTTVYATNNTVQVARHLYKQVFLKDFITELSKQMKQLSRPKLSIVPASKTFRHRGDIPFECKTDSKILVQRVFDRMAHFINKDCIVIAEIGSSVFAAVETLLPKGVTFITQSTYASIGYTVGATVGACIKYPDKQVILFIGDGSIQFTFQDISTLLRYDCKPLIIVLNNGGYTMERAIVDDTFNDVLNWKYSAIPDLFGGKSGFDCVTEGEFEKALTEIQKGPRSLNLIELHSHKFDCSEKVFEARKEIADINNLVGEGSKSPKKFTM